MSQNQKIQTVNVIEVKDDTVIEVASFPETSEGNAAAEELFRQKCKNATTYSRLESEPGLTEEEAIEIALEDGYIALNEDGKMLYLAHSI